MIRATGLEVDSRRSLSLREPEASCDGSRPLIEEVSEEAPGSHSGQNSERPKMASTAGTHVTATISEITTVRARAGPNARMNFSLDTASAAVPAATVSPAVTMIGRKFAVVASAASRRLWPLRRRSRTGRRSRSR